MSCIFALSLGILLEERRKTTFPRSLMQAPVSLTSAAKPPHPPTLAQLQTLAALTPYFSPGMITHPMHSLKSRAINPTQETA